MTSDNDNSDNDLHIAVRYGDLKQVSEALRCRLSPNKIGLYQWSPLHEAASNGYSDIIRILLKHGANPNQTDNLLSNTAVHYAAQEGYPTCLRLLIEAGGDYSLQNKDGHTALDLATRACERVIEKKRVENLIRLPLTKAKNDAKQDFQRIQSAQPTSLSSSALLEGDQHTPAVSTNNSENLAISSDISRVRAWTPQITKPDPGTMGMLHVSFEFNSKKDYLKIRLWKLSGLLISETHSSMINTLYVKSSFIPDARRSSKRKSEEIKISSVSPFNYTAKQRKPSQLYVSDTGTEVIFEPITFKFSKPLVYESISAESMEGKVVYIQVSLKQKYTQKTYKIADLTLPLSVAVTKIVKEAFPLKICTQTRLPESMMILADIKSALTMASDPNLRREPGTPLLHPRTDIRPASDINLREVLSVSSHSPSISIDIPSEEEMETSNELLSQVKTEKAEPSTSLDVVIAMPGAVEGSSDEDDRMTSVEVHATHKLTTNADLPPVRITVTNDDSDSDINDPPISKTKTKLSSLLNKHSTDEVVLLESGQRSRPGVDNPTLHDSVANLSEPLNISLTKHKLRPKLPPTANTADSLPAHSQAGVWVRDSSPASSDVVLSLGDLELQDFDEPAPVHKTCRHSTMEHPV